MMIVSLLTGENMKRMDLEYAEKHQTKQSPNELSHLKQCNSAEGWLNFMPEFYA